MNKKGGLLISSAILVAVLIVGFFFGYSFGNQDSKVSDLEEQLAQKDARINSLESQVEELQNPTKGFTCPAQDVLNCMPPVLPENEKYCSGEYVLWITTNCENSIVF